LKNTSKLSKIYVTELGYIMAKIYYPKKRIFINYKIGNVEELLENKKLDISKLNLEKFNIFAR
jgi:hypothetical protein